MTPEEKAQREVDATDLWLSYPPLAGKVLRIAQVEGQRKDKQQLLRFS
jgi:hypothetical protein